MKLKMLLTYTDNYFYRIRGLFNSTGPTILRFCNETEYNYKSFYLICGDDEEYRYRNAPLKKL